LWLVLPALLTIRHGIPLYDHYFLFLPPAGALLIGVGVQWLTTAPIKWTRALTAIAIVGVLGAACVHTVLVLRQLDFVDKGFSQEYGPPLSQSEALTREVVAFGASSGSAHLAIELEGSDSEPLAYLARPSFPVVDLVKIGPVGLGPQRSRPPSLDGEPPPPVVLGPPSQLDLLYADGVAVLAESSSARALAGERVGVAISWMVENPVLAAGDRVQWQVSLFDPVGEEIESGTGLEHHATSNTPREVVLSWLSVETPTDAPPGAYQLRIRRVDRPNGQPVPFVRTDGQMASDWSPDPIQLGKG
jgi:hypothetical protein